MGRALTLLSALNQRGHLTVSDAAEQLDVAPSTAHRLLQTLVHHGYAKQDDSRVYAPGPASTVSAEPSSPHRYSHPRAIRILRKLAFTVGGTVHVVALEGNSIRFIAGVEGSHDLGIATARSGWLLPAHITAGGRAILATFPDAQLASLYPDGRLPATRFCRIRTVDELRAQIEEIRRRGFATSRAAHEEVCGIGVVLPSEIGPATMAVTAAWPPHRFPANDTANVVHHLRVVTRQLVEDEN
ncbi:IclR family transcriptional regulator [Streptomyces thinghirensis]|uniref:IclR family transcriptional regulator n=1 Tax=Streptomyces thinghirensis TaxID=551547 RepID=UPI0031E59BA3